MQVPAGRQCHEEMCVEFLLSEINLSMLHVYSTSRETTSSTVKGAPARIHRHILIHPETGGILIFSFVNGTLVETNQRSEFSQLTLCIDRKDR